MKTIGRPRITISIERFGSLVSTTTCRRQGRYLLWLCHCDCGNDHWASASDLRRGHVTSCGKCPSRLEKARKSPIRGLYGQYKLNAKKQGRVFELSLEEFESLLKGDCVYCGSAPAQVYHKKGAREGVVYNGVDRQDNSIGYTKGNSVSCCKFCNLAKSRWSAADLEAWIARIRKP